MFNFKFMKKYFILGFLFVLVLNGCGKKMEIEDFGKNTNEDLIEENLGVENNIYRNEKYGFEINFPGNLNKLRVEENKIKKEYSIFGSDGEVTLYFNYQLNDKVLKDKNDLSSGELNDMLIYYFKVIPKKDWKENVCEDKNVDFPCRQGEKLGENDKYVFESGFTSIEGSGDLCVKHGDEQKEFCDVDSNFNEMVQSKKLNFKLVESSKKCDIGKDIVSESELDQYKCSIDDCELKNLGGKIERHYACCPIGLSQSSDEVLKEMYDYCFRIID